MKVLVYKACRVQTFALRVRVSGTFHFFLRTDP